MKRRTIIGTAAAALAVLFLGTMAAHAALIQSDFDSGTFYGGTQGWFPYGAFAMSTVANPPGGTTNWGDVESHNQYYTSITSQDWATPGVSVNDWNTYSHLDFDVILPSATWFPTGNPTLTVEFQSTNGGSNAISSYATATLNGSIKDVVQHVDIDYSALKPFTVQPNWNLSFEMHPGYDYSWDPGNPNSVPVDFHYYLDNVQFTNGVPEPASLGLLAVGGMFAIVRRRTK